MASSEFASAQKDSRLIPQLKEKINMEDLAVEVVGENGALYKVGIV